MAMGKIRASKGKVASSPFEKKDVHLLSQELRDTIKTKEVKNGKKDKEKKG